MLNTPIRSAVTMALAFVFFLGLTGTANAELLVLSPTADSYVDSARPTSNFGLYRTLISSYDAGNDCRDVIFLRFDISAIPGGSSISEATLNIYLSEMTGQNTINLGVYRATSNWQEKSIHWQNKPTGPGPLTTNSFVAGAGYKSLDLTEVLTGWLGGTFPNYGVFLSCQDKKDFVATFSSRDALGSQPQLLVYYSPPTEGSFKTSGMPMASGRAPLITDVKASGIKNGKATITWKTDGMTTSIVRYGLSAAYDLMATSSNKTMDHTIALFELKSGRTYHFRVSGKNKAGLESMSADYKFKVPKEKKVKQEDANNNWGWLILPGIGIGILILIILGVIFSFEFPRWLRGEIKLRDIWRGLVSRLRG